MCKFFVKIINPVTLIILLALFIISLNKGLYIEALFCLILLCSERISNAIREKK